jgi:hypothetical protein
MVAQRDVVLRQHHGIELMLKPILRMPADSSTGFNAASASQP